MGLESVGDEEGGSLSSVRKVTIRASRVSSEGDGQSVQAKRVRLCVIAIVEPGDGRRPTGVEPAAEDFRGRFIQLLHRTGPVDV